MTSIKDDKNHVLLSLALNEGKQGGGGGGGTDPYTGDYIVTPKTTAQVLATNDKYMQDDVRVKSIPYAEVPTPGTNGSTVVIAS